MHTIRRHPSLLLLLLALAPLLAGSVACAQDSVSEATTEAASDSPAEAAATPDPTAAETAPGNGESTMTEPPPEGMAVATFAGGCFWCMEPPYDKLEGVQSTLSGFTGGSVVDPSYRQVTGGGTGHLEAVQVTYDPSKVSYETLLHVFWRNIDPLDDGGQFCDRGASYRTGIFVHDAEQRRLAEASKAEVAERFDEPVVTPIRQFDAFYAAEDYHQNFYEKNPVRYKTYRYGCRRDARLEELWGEEAGGH